VDKAKRQAEAEKTLALVALPDYGSRRPSQLSGGQRQRVAMGRAIVRNPKVFLFDEPLSNLDAKLRVQMRTEIRELHQNLKSTSIYVTHDQIEAMTMADKIVVMRDGRIQQVGTPLGLYDWPANAFVAGFIGSPAMNFLPATALEGGMRVRLASGEELAMPFTAQMTPGQKLLVGLRPEFGRLAATGEGVLLDVLVIEPTGADTTLICRAGATDVAIVLRDRTALKVGERVMWLPTLAKAHLFDEQSGQRVADVRQAV